jgi:hypothetical protein
MTVNVTESRSQEFKLYFYDTIVDTTVFLTNCYTANEVTEISKNKVKP